MKKNEKYIKYFDSLAKNYYNKNIKLDNDFFKFVASKINSSEIYCKSEYVKARDRFYKKFSYFKKNKNIILFSQDSGISINELFNFFISNDFKLNKTTLNAFKSFYCLSTKAFIKKHKIELSTDENKDVKTDRQPSLIELKVFLEYLKEQLQFPLRTDGRINVRIMPSGDYFYSNNAFYQALKKYYKNKHSIDIGSPKDAKPYMVAAVGQLRGKDLLAKKINAGYYSNSFSVQDGDGKVRRENGIFIKDIETKV